VDSKGAHGLPWEVRVKRWPFYKKKTNSDGSPEQVRTYGLPAWHVRSASKENSLDLGRNNRATDFGGKR